MDKKETKKFTYSFINETVEIEVSKEWADVLRELDRVEYNYDHKDTRRHTTLDNGNDDAEWLSCEEDDPSGLFEIYEESEDIQAVISMLTIDQQDLIESVFIKGMKKKEYAAKKGISGAAISQQIKTIRKKLKKLL